MKRVLLWVLGNGIVSTFVAGFFALLPIAITLAIMTWLGNTIHSWMGSDSSIGQFMQNLGFQFVTNEWLAYLLGFLLSLIFILLIGVMMKYVALNQIAKSAENVFSRIPIFGNVFRPVSQVVSLFKKDQGSAMKGMRVVYCEFGQSNGAGFLGLLSSQKIFRFRGQDCCAVYVPTSPIPMSGGILFVPKEQVQQVDMDLDDLMQIYFSMGVMSDHVVNQQYISGANREHQSLSRG